MTDVSLPRHRSSHPLATEQEAREVAEAAREKEWQAPSFVRELFVGSFRLDLVHPFPRRIRRTSSGPGRSWSGSSASCGSGWTATGSTARERSRRT